MKRILLLLIQFVVMSALTYGEIFFVYTTIIMNTHSKITTWLAIIFGSVLIAAVNILILQLLNHYTALHLNMGTVYVLSAVAAVLLCFITGLLFDRHSLLDNLDFNKEIDYIMLIFFALWQVLWSAIISFTRYSLKK